MIQVSMVGYASAGALLRLVYFDLPYNMMAAAVLAHHVIALRASQAASTAQAKSRLPLPAL